jgi:hypothetical protein
MYNLSKDYEKLYDLICNNNIIICFLDYEYNDNDIECKRDVAQIIKDKEGDILIYARGIIYESIYSSFQELPAPKKELFIEICKKSNVEWIIP